MRYLQCNFCPFVTNSASVLIRHMEVKHVVPLTEFSDPVVEMSPQNEKEEEEEVVSIEIEEGENEVEKVEIEGEVVCTICDRPASSRFEMLKHLNNFHFIIFKNNVRIPDFDVSEFELECMYCEETFLSLFECRQHCISSHNLKPSNICVKMIKIANSEMDEEPSIETFRFDTYLDNMRNRSYIDIKTEPIFHESVGDDCTEEDLSNKKKKKKVVKTNGKKVVKTNGKKQKKTEGKKKFAKQIVNQNIPEKNDDEKLVAKQVVGLENATNIYTDLLIETVCEDVNKKSDKIQPPAVTNPEEEVCQEVNKENELLVEPEKIQEDEGDRNVVDNVTSDKLPDDVQKMLGLYFNADVKDKETEEVDKEVNNESRNDMKRKAESQLNKENVKKAKKNLSCIICRKMYIKQECLDDHVTKKHSGNLKKIVDLVELKVADRFNDHANKIIEISDQNKLLGMQVANAVQQMVSTQKKMEDVIKSSQENFSGLVDKYKIADSAIDEARDFDNAQKQWVKIGGLGFVEWDVDNPVVYKNAAEKKILFAEKLLKKMLGNYCFGIVKVDICNQKKGIIDVLFSNSTDVETLSDLLNKNKLNENMFVGRIVQNSNKIRISILCSIGKKVTQDKNVVDFSVSIINSMPTLSVVYRSEKCNVPVAFPYTKAIARFNKVMKPEDFKPAAILCKQLQFFGEQLTKFAIDFPPLPPSKSFKV